VVKIIITLLLSSGTKALFAKSRAIYAADPGDWRKT
jgi:hypothetical protein